MTSTRVAAERGVVLLVVIAACAGLAVMTTMLLLSGLVAYEAAGARAEMMQAGQLAEGTIRQVIAGLAAGSVPLPGPGRPLRVLNGVAAGGRRIAVARFPSPPGGSPWPAVTESPRIQPPGGGYGAAVELTLVTGPRGEARSRLPGQAGVLLRATVQAWFRGATVQRRASLLWIDVGDGRRVLRLD